MTIIFGSAELTDLLTQLEQQMNALQQAVATLTTDVQTLAAAVTASQANQFTPQDVANITTLDTQVKAITAGLTPAPSPTPTPSSTS